MQAEFSCNRSRLTGALICLTLATIALIGRNDSHSMESKASETQTASLANWRQLGSPRQLHPGAGYYCLRLDKGQKVHLVVVDLNRATVRIRPVDSSPTRTVSDIAASTSALCAINGGYFNLSDGASASYVIVSGKTVCDPHDNKALVGNPRLQPFLEQIFQRTEIRFLREPRGNRRIQLASHNEPVPSGWLLVDSLQGGPRILPSIRASDEAFVRVEADGSHVDSIGCAKPAARTAFGITADGHAMLVAIAGKGQDPEMTGVTLKELAEVMKKLGCEEALNLDGGASTTMFVKLPDGPRTVCAKSPETKVSSALIVEAKEN